MGVTHIDAIAAEEVTAADRTAMQVLISSSEAPNFAMRRFIMQPGGGMPYHTNTVEHEQYVLRGRARLQLGDAVHEIGPGNVNFIPAGMPHSYEVIGSEPFEFLCLVPNEPDTVAVVEKTEKG